MPPLSSFSTELARVLATVDERGFEFGAGVANRVRDRGGEVYFVGNGGSAAIASHMAIDWANKGGFRTHDLNNPAALTCLANDYGYENVFSRQLGCMGRKDLLVAISSSGSSANIVKAVHTARERRGAIMTLSGFNVDNLLMRDKCPTKFYIPSNNYAIVENAHMAILHAMLEALK